MQPPLRTVVLDPYEVDVAGVTALLGRFSDRVRLVELDRAPVDVILYGVRERQAGHDRALHALLRARPATVIALGWRPPDAPADWAVACGAHGRLSKTMTGGELVGGLEGIHRGRRPGRALPPDGQCHPGIRAAGLTARELEVLALITRGLANQEIADRMFLSINTVKTYVRTSYRKLGVTRRAQAVTWGVTHGLGAPAGPAAPAVAERA